MATAWVNPSGSNTSPYDTPAKGAVTISAAMTYLASISGPHTLYIVANNYAEGISITSQSNLAGMSIFGLNSTDVEDYADKGAVSLVSASYGVRIEQPDVQVVGLTPKDTTGRYDTYYLNADGIGLSQCYGIDSGRRFFWATASATNLRIARSIFEGSALSCFRNYSPSSIVENSIFRPSTKNRIGDSSVTAESLNASGVSEYKNIIIVGGLNRGFLHNGSGECIITNCIIQCGDGNNGASVVKRSLGTVRVRSSVLIPNWKAPTNIFEGTIAEDSGNIIDQKAGFNTHSRNGYIIPSVDDTASWEYALDVASVLRSNNAGGTFYVSTLSLVDNVENVLSVEDAGMELGFHSRTNAKQDATGGVFEIASSGGTIDIDRDSNSITVTGLGSCVVSGFNSKSLAAIKSELETAGCTVGVVPADLDVMLLGECMDGSSGPQASPYTPQVLVDPTAQSGLFKAEITDPLAEFTSLLGRTPVAFATPRGATSADARAAAKAAGLLCARNGYNGYGAGWKLSSLDIYNLSYIGAGQVCGATIAETRRNMKFLCEMIATVGGIMSIVGHNTDEIDMDEWAAIVSVIKEYPSISIASLGSVVAAIRGGAPWSTSDQVTYTREPWDDVANYRLTKGSPCIRSGVDAGLTTDADGNTIPTDAGFDIGPYFYRPEVDRGYSPWCKCDASLPIDGQICKSHALPIGVGKITVFDGVASQAQINEAKE